MYVIHLCLLTLTAYFKANEQRCERNLSFDNVSLDSIADGYLAALLDSPIVYQLGETTVVRLSGNLVMKGGGNLLPYGAEVLIALKTCIRAPHVHRSFQVTDSTEYSGIAGYIVINYISGQSLDNYWDNL